MLFTRTGTRTFRATPIRRFNRLSAGGCSSQDRRRVKVYFVKSSFNRLSAGGCSSLGRGPALRSAARFNRLSAGGVLFTRRSAAGCRPSASFNRLSAGGCSSLWYLITVLFLMLFQSPLGGGVLFTRSEDDPGDALLAFQSPLGGGVLFTAWMPLSCRCGSGFNRLSAGGCSSL